MPKVSVIIPTYNRAKFVIEAIESVRKQTFRDYEIIVVDDGSTDNTEAYLAEYHSLICYYKIEHKGIPGRTRNYGISKANGELIAFLDSDDYWCSRKLEQQMQLFYLYPDIGFLFSNAYVLTQSHQNGLDLYFPDMETKKGNLFLELVDNNFVITSTVLLKKDLLENVGGFCEDSRLVSVEDYDLWLRIAYRYKALFQRDVLATYRRHTQQYSQRKYVQSNLQRKHYFQALRYIIKHPILATDVMRQVYKQHITHWFN